MTSLRRSSRSLRMVIAAMFAALALTVSACSPSPGPVQDGVDIDFGPLTIPLPPIEVRAPGIDIPLLLCNIGYQPPGVQVIGATVTIPKVKLDIVNGKATVPNVRVDIPQLRMPLSTLTLTCGPVSIPVQIDLIIPSTVVVQAATLDLANRTIGLSNPSFTINGAGIGVNGLDLVVPLPPIVNIPLPSFGIPF